MYIHIHITLQSPIINLEVKKLVKSVLILIILYTNLLENEIYTKIILWSFVSKRAVNTELSDTGSVIISGD